ncbi:MAG TPA: DUF4956 domain-containing protein [Actinomycetales bacterium]|nr:DUF4956 domain-containing protein [Actinomycetales bacterium]
MSPYIYFVADAVAVAILVLALYLPRHRRRDMAVAYLGVNVGVLGVAAVLSASSVAAGLGLGLFGVLSIIRLRSEELSQREVAYYFAALALGLLGGIGSSAGTLLPIGFMAAILLVLAVADTQRLLPTNEKVTVQLDRAIADPLELRTTLAELLGADVLHAETLKLDLVNDATLVAARIRRAAAPSTAHATSHAISQGEFPAVAR